MLSRLVPRDYNRTYMGMKKIVVNLHKSIQELCSSYTKRALCLVFMKNETLRYLGIKFHKNQIIRIVSVGVLIISMV